MIFNRLPLIALILIGLFSACSPSTGTPSSGQQSRPDEDSYPSPSQASYPPPGDASYPPPGDLKPVIIENVQVQVGIGSPLPVEIVASGIWPSQCSQITDIQSSVNHFQIDVTILASMQESCPPDHVGLSFRIALPLNIAQMPAGTYNISVNGIGTTFQLPNDLGEGTGAIFGWVWHDQCDSGQDGQQAPVSTPPGCVAEDSPIGPYHANGVLDSASGSIEGSIEGVTVRLFEGDCASSSLEQIAESETIASDISYSFTGLSAGTYCVYIDPQEDANLSILRPGMWTYPRLGEGDISQTISLQPNEAKYDVNFGWDYQFK